MNFETSELPQEAVAEMARNFEGLHPVISEDELKTLCENNSDLESLLKNMLEYFQRYAVDVWNMQKFINDGGLDTDEGPEEYRRIDDARTQLHNTLVDSIGILSRSLGKAGKNNEWVRELTNGASLNRASCGAFALLLVYRRYLDNQGA